jgi:hypothetical protein
MLKLEQRSEFCPNLLKHGGWRLADKSRASPLPRRTAQLIGLHHTSHFGTLGYRDLQTPVAIAPGNWACNAAAGKFMERTRRKHERGAASALFVGNRLPEVEPNNIACCRAISGHVTTLRRRAGAPSLLPAERLRATYRRAIRQASNAACAPASQWAAWR